MIKRCFLFLSPHSTTKWPFFTFEVFWVLLINYLSQLRLLSNNPGFSIKLLSYHSPAVQAPARPITKLGWAWGREGGEQVGQGARVHKSFLWEVSRRSYYSITLVATFVNLKRWECLWRRLSQLHPTRAPRQQVLVRGCSDFQLIHQLPHQQSPEPFFFIVQRTHFNWVVVVEAIDSSSSAVFISNFASS